MRIRNSSGTIIYDSDSRIGRFMGAAVRLPTSGTIAAGATSATVTIANLENDSNWQVIVLPGVGGTSSMYGGHNFTVNQGSGSFTVTNTGTAANFYNYFIVKSGDTDT